MSKVQSVRGTQDFLPDRSLLLRWVEQKANQIAALSGYGEIMTPMFEFSEVFHRSMGETSDVVHKETYTFLDRGGDSITLRPEGTAGVVRAFISEGLAQNLPLKFFYSGPMFRYERPQKGRYRQFHQIGLECLGYEQAYVDVEVIALAWRILQELGLSEMGEWQINTLGDQKSREAYRARLVEYFSQYKNDLSADSQIRLEKNPLRILDSKDSGDQKLVGGCPSFSESLSPESLKFFDDVKKGLEKLQIPFNVNQKLVRGLDYYCHTVFEFVTTRLGAQGTLIAGGRYDGLVETLGGPRTPGVGWAAGLERLIELLPEDVKPKADIPVALIPADEAGELEALRLAEILRKSGKAVEILWNGNVGKKMKKANALGLVHAMIVGSQEIEKKIVTHKDLRSGQQQELPWDRLTSIFG